MSVWVKRFLAVLAAPLLSRKVHLAMATVVAAYAAKAGWNVSEELVYGILGMGVTVILAIMGEDIATKLAAGKVDAAKVEAKGQASVAKTALASTVVAADASVAVAEAENK